MKLSAERKGKTVRLNVGIHIPRCNDYTYYFEWNAQDEPYAGFLTEAINRQLDDQIEAIRRDAYNQGWEDKTKRRKKRTFFGWCFNTVKMPRD